MKREYQITIDFEMDDYDCEQERDIMLSMLRRLMDSFTEYSVGINIQTGAEV